MNSIQLANSRSTRGASKFRRDQINMEIQKLRDLLPLSESIKDRLFQLQVMSLACIFIRKQRYLPHVIHRRYSPHSTSSSVRQHDGCKALKGFLLMFTKAGKLLNISENASEYLGHSVEEIMSQGDSIFDLIDIRDHTILQAELLAGPPSLSIPESVPDEKAFICRMSFSRAAKRQMQYQKFIIIEGRYMHPIEYYDACLSISPSTAAIIQPIFAAYCQPLINPENADYVSSGCTSMFRSIHQLDMKFLHIDQIGTYLLGYENQEIQGASWYQFLHPQHLPEFSYKHKLCSLNIIETFQFFEFELGIRLSGNSSEKEATALQRFPSLYSTQHTFPSDRNCDTPCETNGTISKEVVDIKSLSIPMASLFKIKKECERFNVSQENVELKSTVKLKKAEDDSSVEVSNTLLDMATPELGQQFSVLNQLMPLDGMDLNDVLGTKRPLPDLKDDIDEFLREVEHTCDSQDDVTIKEELLDSEYESKLWATKNFPAKIPMSTMLNAPFQLPITNNRNIVSLLHSQIRSDIYSLSDNITAYKELPVNYDGLYVNNEMIFIKKNFVH